MFSWFNQLCWVSYVLLCRDIELACDEKVIRQMDMDRTKQYSTALLECSTGWRLVAICPLAFGEIGVKERAKNASYTSTSTLISASAWTFFTLSAVCQAVSNLAFVSSPLERLLDTQPRRVRILAHPLVRGFFCLNTGFQTFLNGPLLFISAGSITNHTLFTSRGHKK